MVIEKFLHAVITQKTVMIEKSNPISGHRWNEDQVVTGQFEVSGCGTSRSFRSIKAAKEYIQFNNDVKFGHLSPKNIQKSL